MTKIWVLFVLLGPPVAAIVAWSVFRSKKALPEVIIGLNTVMPGAGLAAAGCQPVEIVLGALFAQASMLTAGGFDMIGYLIPSMVVGGVWGLLHTPLNPLTGQPSSKKSSTAPLITAATGNISPQPSPLAKSGATPATPRAKEADIDEGYSVSVRCTECGADVDVPVLERMAHCSFCGSDHLVVGHDETLYVTIPEKVTDAASLRGAILDHYRYIHYLNLFKRHVAPLEAGATEVTTSGAMVTRPDVAAASAAAEAAISKRADLYRATLDPQLEISESLHFLAPYRHGMGTLYQAAFGRSKRDQNKELRFAVGTIEAAINATTAADLPQMGRLSYLKALTPAAKFGDEAKALPLDADETALRQAYGDLDRKQLVRDFDVIRMGTVFTEEVAAVVWRPWWIAEVKGPNISETLLVDSAAASVAGQAPLIGVDDLEALPPAAQEPGSGLRFMPMECPTCGFEFTFEPSAVLHFCHNCHRLFGIDHATKHEIDYGHAAPVLESGFDLVPFWEFPLKLRTGAGQVLTDLRHFKDGIDGTLDQIGDDAVAEQHMIYVPAIRCVNTRLMADAFNALFAYITRNPPVIAGERYGLDLKPKPLTVNLEEDEARRFAPLFLANAFEPRDVARVNVHQVAEWLFQGVLQSRGRLIYVPVRRNVTEPFRRYIGRHLGKAVSKVTMGGKT